MRDLSRQMPVSDVTGEVMRKRILSWSVINSGTRNVAGVNAVGKAVAEVLQPISQFTHRIALPAFESIDDAGRVTREPVGDAWVFHTRPDAPRRVLLGIHLDTVYPSDHPFQTCEQVSPERVRGPGVADAKGGIAILVSALEAFERSPFARQIGWTVILNPDEEIGSPSSFDLLTTQARQHDIGLVFEPTLPDGAMVDRRGGSGVFEFIARGRSAHVGRNPADGRNAIHAIAHFVTNLASLNDTSQGVVVSVGRIIGGGPVNVVPDFAIARANVRVPDAKSMQALLGAMQRLASASSGDGVNIEMHGRFTAPPKPLDGPTQTLITGLDACASSLDTRLRWRSSGGVCDGNRLAAAGLPTIDTLGPDGGAIHSPDEFVVTTTLADRTQLVALFLAALAVDRVPWPTRAATTAEPATLTGRNV